MLLQPTHVRPIGPGRLVKNICQVPLQAVSCDERRNHQVGCTTLPLSIQKVRTPSPIGRFNADEPAEYIETMQLRHRSLVSPSLEKDTAA